MQCRAPNTQTDGQRERERQRDRERETDKERERSVQGSVGQGRWRARGDRYIAPVSPCPLPPSLRLGAALFCSAVLHCYGAGTGSVSTYVPSHGRTEKRTDMNTDRQTDK